MVRPQGLVNKPKPRTSGLYARVPIRSVTAFVRSKGNGFYPDARGGADDIRHGSLGQW